MGSNKDEEKENMQKEDIEPSSTVSDKSVSKAIQKMVLMFFIKTSLSLIIVAFIVGGLLYRYPKKSAQIFIDVYSKYSKLKIKSFDIDVLDSNKLLIKNVKLKDNSFKAQEIEFSYDLESLKRRHLYKLRVEGVHINSKFSKNNLTFGNFGKFIKSDFYSKGFFGKKMPQDISQIKFSDVSLNVKGLPTPLTAKLEITGGKETNKLLANIDYKLLVGKTELNGDAEIKGFVNNYRIDTQIKRTNSEKFDELKASAKTQIKNGKIKISKLSFNGKGKDFLTKIKMKINRNDRGLYEVFFNIKRDCPKGKDIICALKTDLSVKAENIIASGEIKNWNIVFPAQIKVNELHTENKSIYKLIALAPLSISKKDNLFSVKLTKEAKIKAKEIFLKQKDIVYNSTKPLFLFIKPDENKNLLEDDGDILSLSTSFSKFKNSGLVSLENEDMPFSINSRDLDLSFDLYKKVWKLKELKTNMKNSVLGFYKTELVGVDGQYSFDEKNRGSGKIEKAKIDFKENFPIIPMNLEASFMEEDVGIYEFQAYVKTRKDLLNFSMIGKHDFMRGKGQAEASIDEISFDSKNGVKLSDIFPDINEVIEDEKGKTAAFGKIFWDKAKGIESDIKLLLEDVDFTKGQLGIQGLTGVVDVKKPWPFLTDGKQKIYVKRLDVGIPLDNGMIDFEIKNKKFVDIISGDFEFFGGKAQVPSLKVPFNALLVETKIDIKDIDIFRFIKATPLSEWSIRGKADASFPVVFTQDNIEVKDAYIKSKTRGMIYYRYDKNDNKLSGSKKKLLNILSRMDYEKIMARINGFASERVKIQLSISGRNRSVERGAKTDLTLGLKGKLDELITPKEPKYNLPDFIEEEIKRLRK